MASAGYRIEISFFFERFNNFILAAIRKWNNHILSRSNNTAWPIRYKTISTFTLHAIIFVSCNHCFCFAIKFTGNSNRLLTISRKLVHESGGGGVRDGFKRGVGENRNGEEKKKKKKKKKICGGIESSRRLMDASFPYERDFVPLPFRILESYLLVDHRTKDSR